MSQYVDSQNQELLWKMFHRIPETSSLEYPVRETLFKEAISYIYNNISPNISHFSRNELQELNRQTMAYLIQQVRIETPEQSFEPPPRPTMPQMVETAEEKTARIFEEKQKQYEQMTAKPNVPKPSELFQEPKENIDGAITNMDELISQYQQQRDQDMPKYDVPPDSIATSTSVPSTPIKAPENTSISQNSEILQNILDSIKKLETRMEAIESQFHFD